MLDDLASRHRTTVAAIALAWLAAQPAVVAPIASARSASRLKELLPAANLLLSPDELRGLTTASDIDADHLGGRIGLWLGVVLSSVEFGAAHLYQSRSSALTAALSGLVFALIYLRRRSGIEAAAAHASADVLSVIAATLVVR